MSSLAHDDENVEQDQHTSVCAICLGPFQGRVYLSPCMHSFCATCLSAWLAVALHCPLCKALPAKLHWGVNTALGILNTIHVQSGPGESVISSSASWKAELRRVASLSEEQEHSRTYGQGGQGDKERNNEDTTSEADEAEDHNEEQEESLEGPRGKRRRSDSFEDTYHGSDSEDRSRSRSVTPIDSYHYYYGDSDNNTTNNISSTSKRSRTEAPYLLSEANTSSSTPSTPPALPRPTRRDIYLYGMEPEPAEEYPLADQILPTDLTFLKPFLERDLAVLTDMHSTVAVEGIVVDHVTNVLKFHANNVRAPGTKPQARIASKTKGASVDWETVEKEIEQWALLSSEWTNMTQSKIAQLFVREMRRIVKRRWRMESWDERVEYRRCNIGKGTPI